MVPWAPRTPGSAPHFRHMARTAGRARRSAPRASRRPVHRGKLWSSGTPACVLGPPGVGSQPSPTRPGPKGVQGLGQPPQLYCVLQGHLGWGGGTCPQPQSASGRAEAGARPAWAVGVRGGRLPALSLSPALSSAARALPTSRHRPLRGHLCPLVAKPGASRSRLGPCLLPPRGLGHREQRPWEECPAHSWLLSPGWTGMATRLPRDGVRWMGQCMSP